MRNLRHGLKGATGSPSYDPNSNEVLLGYKARLLSIHVILPRMEPASFPNNRGDNYMLSWLPVGHSVPEVWVFSCLLLNEMPVSCRGGRWMEAPLSHPFLNLQVLGRSLGRWGSQWFLDCPPFPQGSWTLFYLALGSEAFGFAPNQ